MCFPSSIPVTYETHPVVSETTYVSHHYYGSGSSGHAKKGEMFGICVP